MQVVYYKLPQGGTPENVIVMRQPFYECEIALMLHPEEVAYPLFYVDVDGGDIHVEEGSGEYAEEPMFIEYADGFEAVIPARNASEARDWSRRFYERLVEFRESESGRVYDHATH